MNQEIVIQENSVPSLNVSNLSALGLKEDDIPAIRELASTLDFKNPMTISTFGREVSQHTSTYVDNILEKINNKDLDEAGAKLSQVVKIARSINIKGLSKSRSRIPLVGGLIDKFRMTAENIKSEFETTKIQIENLINEVKVTQDGLNESSCVLEDMFIGAKSEHHLLGVHIAAGRLALEEFKLKAEDMRKTVNSPTDVQELADIDTRISNLDKRIGDLEVVQHSTLQILPSIRLIQNNNNALVDKFHTIREVTIPSWKRQFMLSLNLNQQKNAVELTNNIDDATNELLIRNAKLLHSNSVETAKSNQRLAIDISTIELVNQELVQTVEDVLKIQREGTKQRAQESIKLNGMNEKMKLMFTKTDSTH